MKKVIAVFLTVQFAFPLYAVAQEPVNAAQPAAMVTNGLKIFILEGKSAINNTVSHKGTPPVVEVRDEDDRPVEGATVVFRVPPGGPGAVFPGGSLSRTVKTSIQGQAIATGLTPNDQVGPFSIHVTATFGNRIGELDIDQTNSAKIFAATTQPKRKIATKWKLLAAGVAAGTVVAVVLLLTTGGSKSTAAAASNPTITITAGPVSIGGAH